MQGVHQHHKGLPQLLQFPDDPLLRLQIVAAGNVRDAAVGGDHDVALVGPPLRVPIEGLTFDDLLESGASVGFHEYRQDGFVRVFTIG